jgi:Uncharacterized protein related to plant photosystem II stability/assembly factor
LQDRIDPNVIYLGTNVGVFRSPDRGVTWTLFTPPKPKPVVRRPAAKRTAARKSSKTAAKKTTTAAAAKKTAMPEAEPAPAGPTLVPALTGKVKVLTFTEDGKNGILAGTDSGLYRSFDISKGWEKLPLGEGISDNIFVIHISPKRPETIWGGTAGSGVIVSNDNGQTWRAVNGVPQDVPISSIATDPQKPDRVYVGSTQAFWLSRDGGKTWQRRGGNLPLGNFTSILINPVNTDEIFISSSLESDGGIFYSSDAGMRWKRVDLRKCRCRAAVSGRWRLTPRTRTAYLPVRTRPVCIASKDVPRRQMLSTQRPHRQRAIRLSKKRSKAGLTGPAFFLWSLVRYVLTSIITFSGALSVEQEIACPGSNGNVILRAESIPFSQIPGQSKLFIRYQEDPLSLRQFYPSAVASHAEISERIPEVLANYTTDRGELCDALNEINRGVRGGEKSFRKYLAAQRRRLCRLFLTGQQAGLFTGPLYTIYKALSASGRQSVCAGAGLRLFQFFGLRPRTTTLKRSTRLM